MSKRKLLSAVVATGLFAAQPAFATDICAALLAQGIRDTSSQQVTESRFNELRSNICTASYDSYSKAASQAASGGFDVPGIFGISFGTSSAEQQYSTKWTNFCQADYNLAISNSDLRTYFSTANRAVLNSFDNCVNVTSERFIRYVEPQPDGRTFSITFDNKRQGNATFKVLGISLTDSTSGQVMDVRQSCDIPPPFNHPLPWDTGVPQMNTNAFSIVCRKTPDHAVVVAGTTNAGNIDPVVVQPVPSPGPTIADRVSSLEANLASDFPKGSILTWFLKNGPIPSGWGVCDGSNGKPNLQGFFLRGGSNVADLTDAKQGSNSHMHSVDPILTTTPHGVVNGNVNSNGGSLTVYGTDHTHTVPAFNTKTADNVPEYKSVLFLCR